jgi:hypothetical protein
MRTALQVASCLACVAALHAQVTATLSHTPNGLDEVRIRNGSSSPVVAFAVTATQRPEDSDAATGSAFVVFFDPLINPADAPLAPQEERVVIRRGAPLSGPAFIPRPSPLIGHNLAEPIRTAEIFGDGATEGDPVLVARLMWRRTNMLLAVETTLETLTNAGQRNVPREQLISQIDRLAEALNHWYLSPEQTVGRRLYQSVAAKLRNLPEPALGEAFPPSAFIAEQTAALNRQRVALLDSQPSLADSVLVSAR